MNREWKEKFEKWTKFDSFVLWFEDVLDRIFNSDLRPDNKKGIRNGK